MLAFAAGVVRGVVTKHVIAANVSTHDHGTKDDRLDAFDTPARRKALDGAWVVQNGDARGFSSDYTQPLAISIEGEKAQLWDGRAMQTARVKFDSPCAFALMKPDPEGGESGSIYTYAVHDGAAELLEGDGGERVGDKALVCADHGVYLLDAAGDCSRFESFFGTSKPSKCGFRKEEGKEVFFYDGDPDFKDHENKTLPVDGWRVGAGIDPDVKNGALFHRYKSFDDARAAVDGDARANDPLLIAQAAGGKVGDTTTVPGLVATFSGSSDRDALEDKVVKVTGVAVPSEGVLRLAAADHRDRPTIDCELDESSPVPVGTIVQVEGKVRAGEADWTQRPFGVPTLTECRIVSTLPVP